MSPVASLPDAVQAPAVRTGTLVGRRWWISLLTSMSVHLLALGALTAAVYQQTPSSGTGKAPAVAVDTAIPATLPPSLPVEVSIHPESDARSQPTLALPAGQLQEFIQREFQKSLTQSDRLSGSEVLEQLDQLGGRLQSTSSSRNVVEVGEWVLRSLAVPQRQPAAETKDSEELDVTTAQYEDVRRIDEPGSPARYVAVLQDAAGRRMEVPLDSDAGAELFRLFRLMEKHPLLREVYFTLALPMLDRLMAQRAEEGVTEGAAVTTDPAGNIPSPTPPEPAIP